MTKFQQPPVIVLGRFPPPVDGQSVATLRLAELLEDVYPIERLNTNYTETGRLQANSWLVPGRWLHYLKLSRRNRNALNAHAGAVVLWPAVSPDVLGHFRDLTTVLRHAEKGQRIVAIVHRGNFDKMFTHPLTWRTARKLVDKVAQFVFLDQKLSDACGAWIPPDKRTHIPNTIDAPVTASEAEVEAKQERDPNRPFRLVYLSNMIASKGYGDVLEAARLLFADGVDIELVFVGRWPSAEDERAFQQRIEDGGMSERIRLIPGISDREEMRLLHLESDAFVLPTYYHNEAQPLSIIEALAAGTPVIATNYRGIPEMIDDGKEGFLIPSRSPGEIAEAVKKLKDGDRWRRMSKTARARFDEQFHPEVVREQWIELVGSIR